MRKSIRYLSLCLAICMIFGSTTGCKKNPKDTDSDYSSDISSDITNVDGDNISSDKDSASESDKDSASGSDKDSASESDNTGGNSSTPGNNGTTNKVDASKYRGTTVRYATWKDPDKNEDGEVIDKFEKKYGINVQIDFVAQGEYAQKIIGWIAADKAPDVFIETEEWPATLGIADSIDAMKIDTTDPIWDQATFKNTTVNGKIYGLNTVGCVWSEADCVFYNKKLMQDNNITTPKEYYEAGNWNFATLKKCLQDCKAAGFKGGYIYPDALAASLGAGWVKYENGKMVNTSTNSMFLKVYQYVAELNKEGLLVDGTPYFLNGDVGICIENAFGLKKTGQFASMNQDYLDYTYLPDYDANTKAKPAGITRFYGVCKKAKNPVAAGIFLRYYLDASNYDLNKTFLTTDAANFFFKLTGSATNSKNSYYMNGISHIMGNSAVFTYRALAYEDPSQVTSRIKAKQNELNGYIKTANEYITKYTK